MNPITLHQLKELARNKAEGNGLLTASITIKAEADAESRIIRFVASDETVDRAGDLITVSGWKLDAYRRNPVFLWSHQRSELPLGKAVDVRVENGSLIIAVEFATAEHNQKADQVFRLYKDGYLNAVSVGFNATKYEFIEHNGKSVGIRFLEQELLELSACNVPFNPSALMIDRPKQMKHARPTVAREYSYTRNRKGVR